MSSPDTTLFEATYTAAANSDPEHAQSAIERNDLPHREIEHFVWLIQVPAPASTDEWQRRLNESVAAKHGSFRVAEATADEKRRVESGEITLQK